MLKGKVHPISSLHVERRETSVTAIVFTQFFTKHNFHLSFLAVFIIFHVSKNYLQCLPETVQMRAIKVELTRCQKLTLAPVGLRTQFKHFSEMQRMTKIDSLLQKKKTGLVELNCQPRKLDSFAKSNWQILRIVLHDQHEYYRSHAF